MSCANNYVVFGCPFIYLKWRNQDVLANFCTDICSVFWCADVVLFMTSTSGTKLPNVLNYALHAGGVLSTGVVKNKIMNEVRAAEDFAAPVASTVLNDTLPAGDGLPTGVVENVKMREV